MKDPDCPVCHLVMTPYGLTMYRCPGCGGRYRVMLARVEEISECPRQRTTEKEAASAR